MDAARDPQNTDTDSAYDDSIKDLLQQQLYTQGWDTCGSLEECKGPNEHPACAARGACDGLYFSFMYVESARHGATNRKPVQVHPRDTEESVELMPSDSSLFGQYWEYFRRHVFDGTKGECIVNVCKYGIKSPSFDILECVVALTRTKPPQGYTWTKQGDDYWMLFVPNSVVSNLIDSLNEVGVAPLPSAHDTQSYNSSRVSVVSDPVVCEVAPCDWQVGDIHKSVSRFVSCEAVATATLTVSVLLIPYPRARGTHTSKKYMSLVVHNIK